MKQILVVDDDLAMQRLIEKNLTTKGYEVLKASGGQEALKILFANKPHLVLLDVVMPGMDGWQTCSRIREVSDVPVIMMTGQKNTEGDIVRGLEHGADEYLLKPLSNNELLARVRAALRRAELPSYTQKAKETVFNDDYLAVDIAERRVMVDGERVRLTPREFRLLALLMENANRVLTHEQVLEKVWGWEYIDDVDYVRIYVAHLRRKIEPDTKSPRYILTEPGVGYYFCKAG
ncbi:response regulator transcription factor [Chloroflexota bacterium]